MGGWEGEDYDGVYEDSGIEKKWCVVPAQIYCPFHVRCIAHSHLATLFSAALLFGFILFLLVDPFR